jgi:hypothetical protein
MAKLSEAVNAAAMASIEMNSRGIKRYCGGFRRLSCIEKMRKHPARKAKAAWFSYQLLYSWDCWRKSPKELTAAIVIHILV